jgi:hypothetical protein
MCSHGPIMSLRHGSQRRLEKILEIKLEGVGVGGGIVEVRLRGCLMEIIHDGGGQLCQHPHP